MKKTVKSRRLILSRETLRIIQGGETAGTPNNPDTSQIPIYCNPGGSGGSNTCKA